MTIGADPALGETLLVQRPSKGNIGNAIFLMVLGVPMMLVALAAEAPSEVRIGLPLLGCCVSGFAVIMLWRNWMHVFLQERGIREYRQRRGRSLPYDQVEEVVYSSLRLFAHGSYIHTVQKLALRSERLPGPPLVCTLIFKEADGRSTAEMRTALTDVRDRVSAALARRLLELVRREGAVDWSRKVRIGKAGIEVKDREGCWEVVPWQEVRRFVMAEGTLRLWLEGEEQPPVEINMAEVNFYPALALALRLQREAGA